MIILFFFFNDTATTEIYTLSLHDALPIFLPGRLNLVGREDEPTFLWAARPQFDRERRNAVDPVSPVRRVAGRDRKSTRLNSSHANISYAVFCLKKKKKIPEV